MARGDRDVARSIATNQQARLSEKAFTALVERAEQDGVLAEKVGLRTDIPPRLFRQLLIQATDVVQKRLLAQAKPETQAEIRRVLAKVSNEVGAKAAPRNYAAAMQTVRALHAQRKLGEADIAEFAKAAKYEETIAALATVCAVPVEVVDRLMSGERSDPVLILARVRRLRLADRERHHQCAAGRQRHLDPGARCRAGKFRQAHGRYRATRGAVLAGASGHRRINRRISAGGTSGSRARGLRVWPWLRNACRQNPATARANRRQFPRSTRNPSERSRCASVHAA